MEIVDLIRNAGRMAWLVLVLPLVAGLGAAAYQTTLPARYSATATVFLSDKSNGAQAFARDFNAATTTDPVIEAAAKASKVTPAEVRSGLVSRTVKEGSTVMEVTWSGPNRRADVIAAQVARAAYLAIAQPSYNKDVAALKVKVAQLAAEKAKLDKISKVEPPDPKTELNTATTELTKAKGVLARASGDAEKKAAQEKLDAAQARFDQASKDKTTAEAYDRQSKVVQEADKAADTAARELGKTKAPAAAVDEKGSVTAGSVAKTSAGRALLRAGAGGAVVGLIAAVLVLVMLQTMAGSRQTRKARKQAARQTPRPGAGPQRPERPAQNQPRNGAGSGPARGRAAGHASSGQGEPFPVAAGNGRSGQQVRPPEGPRSSGRGQQSGRQGRRQPAPPAPDVDALPWIFGDPQQQQPPQRPTRSGY